VYSLFLTPQNDKKGRQQGRTPEIKAIQNSTKEVTERKKEKGGAAPQATREKKGVSPPDLFLEGKQSELLLPAMARQRGKQRNITFPRSGDGEKKKKKGIATSFDPEKVGRGEERNPDRLRFNWQKRGRKLGRRKGGNQST